MSGKKRREGSMQSKAEKQSGPIQRKFRAVLFDKDGVLLNSIDACLRAANETFEHYGKKGMTKEEFRKNFWGTRADINIAKTFTELPPDKLKEIYDYYNQKKLEFEDMIKLYSTVIYTLEALKGKYKLGVVTSSSKKVTLKLLEDFGILKYFDVVVGGMDTEPKPAPDPILKACEMLGVKPTETVYVGDTLPDIEAGKAAGCTVVIVTTSMSREELQSTAGVENIFIIDGLKDLTKILGE